MYRIERYGRRHWAVYRKNELICVTVYKKGARRVRELLQGKSKERRKTCDS